MSATVRRTTTFNLSDQAVSARVQVDRRNERLRVLSYEFAEIAPLADELIRTAQQNDLGVISICVRGTEWQEFLTRGFAMEGRVERFYNGTPGHFMTFPLRGERQASDRVEEKQTLLQSIFEQPLANPSALAEGYQLVTADEAMAEALAEVYDEVFESYPSPLTDPAYVAELMRSGAGVFMVVLDQGQIASAAAAEIDWPNRNAEMTNCATHADYRGEGLMPVLIQALEGEMKSSGITCVYSMARALSHGMNLVLHRAGYTFRGRLINPVHIGGGFEDLNLWEKSL